MRFRISFYCIVLYCNVMGCIVYVCYRVEWKYLYVVMKQSIIIFLAISFCYDNFVCVYVCVCVCIVITRTDIAESSINHSIDLYYDLVRLQWKFYSTDMD